MKIFKSKNKVEEYKLNFKIFEICKLRYIPIESWLVKRMEEFNYNNSFENFGMIWPIVCMRYPESKYLESRLKKNKHTYHYDSSMEIIKGIYIILGHKRVHWSQNRGYTHIEGYLVDNKIDLDKIKRATHIPHSKINHDDMRNY